MITIFLVLGSQGTCIEEERKALLEIKTSLIDSYGYGADKVLPTWVDRGECCDWERVECNTTTGRVTTLSLQNLKAKLSIGIMVVEPQEYEKKLWPLNVSVFLHFEELTSLNLSLNYLDHQILNTEIKKLERLKKLEILDLSSNSNIDNTVFASLATLTSLRVLDLSNIRFEGPFPIKELEALDNLEMLSLAGCAFNGFERAFMLKKLDTLILNENQFNENILSSLKFLPSLKNLDLSGNNLSGPFPPQAFTSFRNLEVLDLSYNKFVGSIPSTINLLSSLKVVSFANNMLEGSLLADHGLCELKNLQELDLSHNMLNGSMPECFKKLSSLKLLDISSNRFTGMPLLQSLIPNLKALEYIDFSFNNFEGDPFSFSSFSSLTKLEVVKFESESDNDTLEVETEDPIGWIPTFQLKFLMLPKCNMNGAKGSVFPSFLSHQNKLQVLDLSHNSLKGQFPNWLIKNNPMLEVLNLRNNSFGGTFSLPLYENDNAWWIDISSNHINGTIPDNIHTIFPNIAHLNFSKNALRGHIPPLIGDLSELFALDLSYNELSGEVPKGLFTNTSVLTILHLSFNKLYGELLSGNLTMGSIDTLRIDGNFFTGKIGNAESNSLFYLDISNNIFTGVVPSWISNMKNNSELVMNNNRLEGEFPCGTTSFRFFDISHNFFSGPIPSCLNFQNVTHLHLGSNRFSGSIPDSFRNLTNVMTLDIGNNYLSGMIPEYLGELLKLRILILRENNFSGPVPKTLCEPPVMSLLDLSSNSLSGSVPSCLQIVAGPSYLALVPSFRWLLPSDLFYGYGGVLGKVLSVHNEQEAWGILEEIQFTSKSMSRPYKGNVLDYMTGLDLSSNKLTGEIPGQLGFLNQIHTLNLSNNDFVGPIPVNFSNLASIESLDLSSNNLTGNVPSELINLNNLAVFNVSYNNLSGKLPEMKGQFSTFTNASYQGNPLLCGPPLEKKCTTMRPLGIVPSTKEENDRWYDIDVIWFATSLSATWIVFLLGLATVLYTNPNWRRMWFNFIEESLGSQGVCIEEERNALLEIKASLIDSYSYRAEKLLPTWVDRGECCEWERVKCNTRTGHVTALSLHHLEAKLNIGMMVEFQEYDKKLWPLNVSVFLHFEELRSLNLSWNYLDSQILNTEIKKLVRLKKLEILDLSSNSDINRTILASLATLTSLRVLDLSNIRFEGPFPINELGALHNLEILSLTGCVFNGFERAFVSNKLETLILNENHFNESIFSSLKLLPSLKNLDLSGNAISGPFPPQGCKSLSKLKRLKSIALADIDFNDGKSILSCLNAIPFLKILDLSSSFWLPTLASFNNLEVLYLSYNSFVGSIPSMIKSLSSLRVLSFANNTLEGSLLANHGLCELKNLQELDLSHNMLNGNLPECLNKLSSLKLLDISSNQFTGMPHLQSLTANLTALEYIDFSDNNFEGPFSFSSFSNLSKLEVVKFISNNDKLEVETEDLVGWIPSFQLKFLTLPNCNMNRARGSVFPSFLFHQNKLQVLDLSHNSLKGPFPNWLIKNNTMLEVLNLRNNSLGGDISLPLYENANAWWIDISSNHIIGTIPRNMHKFSPYLAHLNLSGNALSGHIPSLIGDLSELFVLDLSDNELSGEVPKGLFTNTSTLTILLLSNNKLHGEVLLGNLTLGRIDTLRLNGNYFTGKIGNATRNSLVLLDIGNNIFTGIVPGWISNMQDESQLVINNNMLEGSFPCGTNSFQFFDISHNFFSGSIPSCLNLQYVQHLHFGFNRFTGSIPDSFRNLTSILTLDIGNNYLSGTIPKYFGELLTLRILLLRDNNFSGTIPKQICQTRVVSLLDLSGNSLSGSIPTCLNIVTGPSYLALIPSSGWSYPRELFYGYASVLGKVLPVHDDQQAFGILEEVHFTSKSISRPYKGNVLEYMTGLDLSRNKLTGEIPGQLGFLSQIHTLNVSNNEFTGPIPVNFSNLASIESLDVSSNNLTGNVPLELTNLNNLAVFNVSYNNLSGKLPEMKGQFSTFTKASYEGNPLLCGPPLEKNCTAMRPRGIVPSTKEDINDRWYDVETVWFVASLSSTWIVFWLGLAAVLYTNPYWRRMWFHFIEECMYTFYYFLVDLVTRPSVLLFRR
ncbi:hypothetical protein SSX86_010195 [Deinandra increscens subsp. villosa]|uniref:Leucine-rich repeat-containing N-terminal plant-type domain-containing protein n=1 Tax=Deinandra increscens subsp. villosa TaxID=3103831 RepID=A0AAP0D7J7_9ASTR